MTSQTYSTGKIIPGNYTLNSHYMYRLGGIATTSSNTRFCSSYTTPPVTHNPYSVQPGHMQITLVNFLTTQPHDTTAQPHDTTTQPHDTTYPHDWSHGRSHGRSHAWKRHMEGHMIGHMVLFFHQYRSPECTSSSHVCKCRSHVCTAKVTCMHSHIT
jgi:hypothetical protein